MSLAEKKIGVITYYSEYSAGGELLTKGSTVIYTQEDDKYYMKESSFDGFETVSSDDEKTEITKEELVNAFVEAMLHEVSYKDANSATLDSLQEDAVYYDIADAELKKEAEELAFSEKEMDI